MASTVRVEGAARLRRTLRKAGHDLAQLKAAHKEAATIAADKARQDAPRQSGDLAGTIRAAGTNTAAIVRAGFKAIPYGPVIHWGWPGHNITANPFLTEAAQETEPQWFAVYDQALDQALSQVKGI